MSVRQKLFTIMAIVLLGMAVTLFVLLGALNQLRQTHTLSNETQRLITRGYELALASDNLLTTSGLLRQELPAWEEQRKTFNSELRDFLTDPQLVRDYPNRKEDIEGALNLWSYMDTRMRESKEDIEDILDETNLPEARKTGVLELRRYILESQEQSIRYLIFNTARLERQLPIMRTDAVELIEGSLGKLQSAIEERSQVQSRQSFIYGILVSSLAALVALSSILLFSLRFSRRIHTLENAMEEVSKQNLTITLEDKNRDEIGNLSRHLLQTTGHLKTVLNEVKATATQVTDQMTQLDTSSSSSVSAVHEITQNISSMNIQFQDFETTLSSSLQQVASLITGVEQIAHTIDSQNSAIESSSSAIEQMAGAMQSANSISQKTKDQNTQLVLRVEEGGNLVQETSEQIIEAAKDLGDIREIVEIIDSISSQTNLLSMNAAIESAHAGEAGKGFAVVAEEIRKLADSTRENAERIGTTIDQVTSRIESAVQTAATSSQRFEDVAAAVQEFSQAMDQINHALVELQSGTHEILEDTTSLSRDSQSLTSETQGMISSTQQVRGALDGIKNHADAIKAGLGEINQGTGHILEQLERTNTLSSTTSTKIKDLDQLLRRFKTG